MSNFLKLMDDVDINSLADGDVFVYEASTKRMRPSSQKAMNTTGNLTSGNLTVTTDATIGGNVTVTGNNATTGNVTVTGNDAVTGNRTTTGNNATTGNQTVGGTLGVTGVATLIVPMVHSAGNVAAAGTVQGNATAITKEINLATGADGTKGVALPAAVAGLQITVKNADAANAILKVYPAGNATINAIAAASPISMAAKTSAIFSCHTSGDAGAWTTTSLLPS